MSRNSPLRDYVREPALSELDCDRIWHRVEQNGTPRGNGPRFSAIVVLGIAGAIAAGSLGWRSLDRARPTASVAQAPAPAPAEERGVTLLADGSHARLLPGATLRILDTAPAHARTRLVGGSAVFDVVHDPARLFVVEAGDCEIHVLGTRFEVTVDHEGPVTHTSVTVYRGAVRVVQSGETQAVLRSGETWRQPLNPTPPADALPFRPVADATGKASPPPPATTSKPNKDSASALFDRADAARLRGEHAQAAALFDELRRTYPAHALSGLAAFELGRIRLDALHDARGAAEALTSALTLAPGAPFREDVEARRVEAYQALGALDACRAAQESYLARYPRGPHADVVRRRCATKR